MNQPIDLNDVYARAKQRAASDPQGLVIAEAIEHALRRRPRVGIGSIAVGVFLGLLMWSMVMWLIGQAMLSVPR